MKCAYHADYRPNLPANHPFPMGKYRLVKDQLLEERILDAADFLEPSPLARDVLELVHDAAYLDKLESAALSPAEVRRLGLPWNNSLWPRARLVAGGTLLAAHAALAAGLGANLAGGTHHAFADHGEGFCLLNDVAVAICKLRVDASIDRAAIVDLDVHQGNGTAAIFENHDDVFTFSMHGERNYPSDKMRSHRDVALDDGTDDASYMELLGLHLPEVLNDARPDIVFYLAGVDVAAGDRYGRLSLTRQGIRERDRFVIESVRDRGIPLVIVLAGGYAETTDVTASLHTLALREAVAYERRD